MIHQLYLTQNECYKIGRTINIIGIMVHSTGANNPNLKRYVGPDDGLLGYNQYNNLWNQLRPDGQQKCVHAFIGKLENGDVATYQTLPWNYRGWHAGGDANNTHIGFEICEDGLNDSVYFDKIYKEAIDLCVHLCKQFKLTEKNIICHSEGAKMGIASNHADVMHWFPRHGKNMDMFRLEVKKILTGGGQIMSNIPDSWAKTDWDWAKKEGWLDGTRPKDNVTRQELAVVLRRLVEKK